MSMGGGQSTTTTTQELSPEQRALIEPVIPIAKNYLKNPPKQYKGSAIAGFDPLQKEAQQMTMSAADQMLPITGQTGNNYLKGLAGYDQLRQQQQFLTSGDVLRVDSNPYLQGAIEAASRPTIQQFQQQILPGIQNESINSGAYGGTRQGIASGIAGQAATQSLADIASKMSNENYQAGLGAMVQGQQNANQTLAGRSDLLQNQSNILQQSLLPAQLKESVGAQQQMMKQQLLSEKVQKFVNGQMIPFSVAQDVAQMAFGMPGGTTKSVSDQPGNPMMGMQMGMAFAPENHWRYRLLPTRANGLPAAAVYFRSGDDAYEPFGIQVLQFDEELVAANVTFLTPALLPLFRLPPSLPMERA